jgi:hypothetical protein
MESSPSSQVNVKNEIKEEISKRIQKENECYFTTKKLLTPETKVRVHKTSVRPVMMYGSETWTSKPSDELRMFVFGRKILRKYIIQYKRKENGE